MTALATILSLLVGGAYLILGAQAVRELWSGYRSLIGVGFALAAATCGPHHLVHAEHLIRGATAPDPIETAATLVSAVPAVLYVALRIEAGTGGPGDRILRSGDHGVQLVALTVTMIMGGLGAAAITAAFRSSHVVALPAVTGVTMCVAYLVVAWYMAETQMERFEGEGVWSLSGVALTGIFTTCAFSHLAFGVAGSAPDLHLNVIDAFGVPASVGFATIVRRLHLEAARAWATRPRHDRIRDARPAPWAT